MFTERVERGKNEQVFRASCVVNQDINGVKAASGYRVCIESHCFRINCCGLAEEKYHELFFFIILTLRTPVVFLISGLV